MNYNYLLKLAKYADKQPISKGDKYLLRKLYAIRLIEAELLRISKDYPSPISINVNEI